MPVVASMLPTVGLLLLHVPPPILSVSVIEDPAHTLDAPFMLPGAAIAVMLWVAAVPQPVL